MHGARARHEAVTDQHGLSSTLFRDHLSQKYESGTPCNAPTLSKYSIVIAEVGWDGVRLLPHPLRSTDSWPPVIARIPLPTSAALPLPLSIHRSPPCVRNGLPCCCRSGGHIDAYRDGRQEERAY